MSGRPLCRDGRAVYHPLWRRDVIRKTKDSASTAGAKRFLAVAKMCLTVLLDDGMTLGECFNSTGSVSCRSGFGVCTAEMYSPTQCTPPAKVAAASLSRSQRATSRYDSPLG